MSEPTDLSVALSDPALHERVRRMLIGMGLSAADADDALQSALVKVWRNAPDLEAEGVVSYMMVAARNCAISALRRRRPESEIADKDLREEALGPEEEAILAEEGRQRLSFELGSFETEVQGSEAFKTALAHFHQTASVAVRMALRELSDAEKAALVVRFWGEHSLEETAQVLAMKKSTTASHIFRGLAKLRERLSKEDLSF